jgi:hypothetical protein
VCAPKLSYPRRRLFPGRERFANITSRDTPATPNSFLDAAYLQQVGRAGGCLTVITFCEKQKPFQSIVLKLWSGLERNETLRLDCSHV